MLVLDSDVLIDVQRSHAPAVAWFAGLSEMPRVPGLVLMELIQGANNARQVREVLDLTAPFTVVWPTTDDCQRALTDFVAHRVANGLGLLDSLIAACAVGLSAELCTFNEKHFRMISGLKTVRPYQR